MSWPRVIVHADMDAFYAAVEELDDPSLKAHPLVIGGTRGRGVVTTANYLARRYGIHSAMPMATALRRCPHAVARPPRFERYSAVSKVVMDTFRTFSAVMQPLSIDEAFLDVTEAAAGYPGPAELGRRLKDAVRAATGLTVSVGIAQSKYVAKVASDFDKPDGLVVVNPGEGPAFLAPQPVSRLWGAGPKTVARLHALGFFTIGDIARADPGFLSSALGRQGLHFLRLAHAEDDRPVRSSRTAKSVSTERTLLEDIVGAEAIRPHLAKAAAGVASRLLRQGARGRGVRVKLKTSRFRIVTRQVMLDAATDDAGAILASAERLLAEFELAEPVRLVGVGVFALEGEADWEQLNLPLSDYSRLEDP